jgi:hypothetical protein
MLLIIVKMRMGGSENVRELFMYAISLTKVGMRVCACASACRGYHYQNGDGGLRGRA